MNQAQIVERMLKQNLIDSNPTATPMHEEQADVKLYWQKIGKLLYLNQQPRRHSFRNQCALTCYAVTPETAHGGHKTSTTMSPRTDLGILFKNDIPDDVEGFTDSDRAGDSVRRCSTYAYILKAGGVPTIGATISNKLLRNLSSTEEKYRSLAEGTNETLWLQQLLQELRLRKADAINIHCDNNSTMKRASTQLCMQELNIMNCIVTLCARTSGIQVNLDIDTVPK